MTISPIAIWNRALGFLGTRTVASERENTPEAVQCDLYWDSARRQVLRDFPWSFAPEFRFAYALPEDCLKCHEVRHEGLQPRPFTLAQDTQGAAPLLATGAARALLLYTADVHNSRLFDDLFAHLLSRKLAALVPCPCSKTMPKKWQSWTSSMPKACLRPARPPPLSGRSARRPIAGLWRAKPLSHCPSAQSYQEDAMTMPYSASRALFKGNAAARDFPFTFRVWGASQLLVNLTAPDGKTSQGTGWTATLSASGGTVHYLHNGTPLPAGWKLSIVRQMPFDQEIDMVSGTSFDPQVIEDGLDQATAERQQLREQLSRAVILPPTSDQTPQEMVDGIYNARDTAVDAATRADKSAKDAEHNASASAGNAALCVEARDQSCRCADRSEAARDVALQQSTAINELMAAELAKINSLIRSGLDNMNSAVSLARKWAIQPEDMPVTQGEDGSPLFSARHWAFKSSQLMAADASTSQKGIVRIGAGLSVASGVISTIPFLRGGIIAFTGAFGGAGNRYPIPRGSGTPDTGWVICDGGDGTPNLRDRFLLGSGASFGINTVGGNWTHGHGLSAGVGDTTLAEWQMPHHNHGTGNFSDSAGGGWDAMSSTHRGSTYYTSGTGGSGAHGHSFWGSVAATWEVPPYYALAFIMKL